MDGPTAAAARTGLRLALAHHPLCTWFRHDTLGRGPARVCHGCAFAAPAALIGFALGLASISAAGTAPVAMAAAGLVLGLPHLTSYLRPGTRPERAAAKALGGLGIGLVAAGVLALPVGLTWKLAMAGVAAVAILALQAVRARRILRVCLACPWRADWQRCPGFRPGAHERPEWRVEGPAPNRF